MATQKKTGGAGPPPVEDGAVPPAPAGSRAKSGRTSSAQRPVRREVGALVCLLLAVFSALGYFNMKAIFISWFCALLKGLLGYGFLLTPPALVLAAYILAFHRGRPVRLRVTCALLLPLIFACLLHGMLIEPMEWSAALWDQLMESGKALHSGGALGGLIAQSFVSLFTALGATVVFALAGFFVGLAAFDRSIVDVADWVFNRPAYDYEPEPVRRSRRPERGNGSGMRSPSPPGQAGAPPSTSRWETSPGRTRSPFRPKRRDFSTGAPGCRPPTSCSAPRRRRWRRWRSPRPQLRPSPRCWR